MQHEHEREHEEVRRWLDKARNDWSVVLKLLGTDQPELDIIAFHCQQAVEKLLKAYLVHLRSPFEKIHDLGRLLDDCERHDEAFASLREQVAPLTIFAVAFRYPGPAEPGRKHVDEALNVVEKVWVFVTDRLPGDVVPDRPR